MPIPGEDSFWGKEYLPPENARSLGQHEPSFLCDRPFVNTRALYYFQSAHEHAWSSLLLACLELGTFWYLSYYARHLAENALTSWAIWAKMYKGSRLAFHNVQAYRPYKGRFVAPNYPRAAEGGKNQITVSPADARFTAILEPKWLLRSNYCYPGKPTILQILNTLPLNFTIYNCNYVGILTVVFECRRFQYLGDIRHHTSLIPSTLGS